MKRKEILPLLLEAALLLLLPCFGTAAEPIRVACIGNSVTYGYMLEDPARESYPTVLGELLGERYEVANFGHSGATLLTTGHLPYVETEEYAAALAFRPDIAVVHLGLNDTDPRNFPHYRDRFVRDYCALIDTLRAVNPEMEIWVCSMTPIFTCHPRFISSTQDWYRTLQPLIRRVVEARGTHFIDLYSAFRHRPDLITDAPTLHPNKAGARHLAETVLRALTGNYGGLSVDGIWQSHMVLQQGSEVTLSGHANRGDRIRLSWRGKSYSSETVGDDGHWSIAFPTGEATNEPRRLTIEGREQSITLEDLLVGEVWLVSGQSNMAFSLRDATGGAAYAETKGATDRPLRLCRLTPFVETDDRAWPKEALERANALDFYSGAWEPVSPEAALRFSAVGFAFATTLSEAADVPLGVIEVDCGGSPLSSWVSRDLMEQDARFTGIFDHWRDNDYTMRWCRERMGRNLELTADPFQRHSYDPAFNEETGLRLLYGQSLAGIVWYQGESDAENAEQYELLFPHFVGDLRRHFGSRLPILNVQLSSLDRPSWGRFRDLQRRLTEQFDGVELVVGYDLGEDHEVHFHDKIPLGERAGRLALQTVYDAEEMGEARAARPLAAEVSPEGWIIRLETFGSPLVTSDGEAVRDLTGETLDGRWIPLRATIDGSSLRVERPEGEAMPIVSIAYAFSCITEGNLFLRGGQPVPTFILPTPTH